MNADKDETKTLEEYGIFPLFQEIDEDSMEEAVRFILEANLNKKHDELTLIINSCGGSCHDGFALIDIMAGSKIPVRTVGIGALASMGLTIFIAGEKGKRTLTPNTLIMSHQWAGGVEGKEHELLAAFKHHQMLRDKMVKHYRKHTGLSDTDVKKYLFPASDVFLTAQEAKKLGLCDIVKDV